MNSINIKINSSYTKWSGKHIYSIGKYAPENGPAATVRKLKRKPPTLNEITVGSFEKNVEAELKNASKEKRELNTAIAGCFSATGCPLLLGQVDSMIQTYLLAQSQRGCEINTSTANATPHMLIKRNPQVAGNIDLESSSWPQSLFWQMGLVKRQRTSVKVETCDATRKEIEFLFHHKAITYLKGIKFR